MQLSASLYTDVSLKVDSGPHSDGGSQSQKTSMSTIFCAILQEWRRSVLLLSSTHAINDEPFLVL
jgi:hypothetical protein